MATLADKLHDSPLSRHGGHIDQKRIPHPKGNARGLGVSSSWASAVSEADKAEILTVSMIGKTIPHYHILEKLGEGGMSVVYKAEYTSLWARDFGHR